MTRIRRRSCAAALFVPLTLALAPAPGEQSSFRTATTSAAQFTVMHAFDNVPLRLNQVMRGSDGNFYGTSKSGGANDQGAVFAVTPGGTLTVLHWFTGGSDGGHPQGALIQATDGNFYGTTEGGGTAGHGVIFRITPAGTLTVLHSFSGATEGRYPSSGVIQASDGHFYGTTSNGGASGRGTVFKMTADGALTVLYAFAGTPTDGDHPIAAPLEGTDHNFYGTTLWGGASGGGVVFRMTPAGGVTILHHFSGATGSMPWAPLLQATDGNFYGTTTDGGPTNRGTVFKMTPAGVMTVVHAFTGGTDGDSPYAPLMESAGGVFFGTTHFGGAFDEGMVFKMTAAGVVTPVHSFAAAEEGGYPDDGVIQYAGDLYGTTLAGLNDGLDTGTLFKLTLAGTHTTLRTFAERTDGSVPNAPPILGSDGNFYGTTYRGGGFDAGTVFRMTPGGAVTVLRVFDYLDTGRHPETAVLEANDGNFYATTSIVGYIAFVKTGTVVKITPAGIATLLHEFTAPEGAAPAGALIQGSDGDFYGTNAEGGSRAFKMTPAGIVTVLHAFTASDDYGRTPRSGLVQGSDGNLYGTTSEYGEFSVSAPRGTVFKMTPGGAMTTLHTFSGPDGATPWGEVVQAADGQFYGTTRLGGASDKGVAYKVTADGSFTLLHEFSGAADGANPRGALIQGLDGNFYGTAQAGGTFNYGTVFSMTPAGVVTVQHHFTGLADGASPRAGLVQAPDGKFYGTAAAGGQTGSGVVFRLAQPAPFTDDTLTSGVSAIRAVHILELRTRVNAVRSTFGLGPYSFTEAVLTAGSTAIRAQHILDLRAALVPAYMAAGLTPPTYTDPGLSAGTAVKAAHIAELRAAVIAIE